jgi:hypothetical protein
MPVIPDIREAEAGGSLDNSKTRYQKNRRSHLTSNEYAFPIPSPAPVITVERAGRF